MPEIYRTDLPNIMHETIDNEVVVVNLDKGTYYSFDGVGGRVWDWLGGDGQSLESLVAKAAASFAGERDNIAATVQRFVEQLHAEQLVSVTAAEAGPAVESAEPAADAPAFAEPVLQKYTDMEALLLVDPIHEVDEEAGWPQVK
ncbi:PqqD family protein [Methylomagnum sp.]